jgi:hypothetical protein
MEDELEDYKRPLDPLRPLFCMDEKPKQLIGQIRHPLSIVHSRPADQNYESIRLGTSSIFLFMAPPTC